MRILVATLIDIEGPLPTDADSQEAAAFFAKALEPGAIKGCWFYPVVESDNDLPEPNVSGGNSLQ